MSFATKRLHLPRRHIDQLATHMTKVLHDAANAEAGRSRRRRPLIQPGNTSPRPPDPVRQGSLESPAVNQTGGAGADGLDGAPQPPRRPAVACASPAPCEANPRHTAGRNADGGGRDSSGRVLVPPCRPPSTSNRTRWRSLHNCGPSAAAAPATPDPPAGLNGVSSAAWDASSTGGVSGGAGGAAEHPRRVGDGVFASVARIRARSWSSGNCGPPSLAGNPATASALLTTAPDVRSSARSRSTDQPSVRRARNHAWSSSRTASGERRDTIRQSADRSGDLGGRLERCPRKTFPDCSPPLLGHSGSGCGRPALGQGHA